MERGDSDRTLKGFVCVHTYKRWSMLLYILYRIFCLLYFNKHYFVLSGPLSVAQSMLRSKSMKSNVNCMNALRCDRRNEGLQDITLRWILQRDKNIHEQQNSVEQLTSLYNYDFLLTKRDNQKRACNELYSRYLFYPQKERECKKLACMWVSNQ